MTGWDYDSGSSSNKQEFAKFPVGLTNIRIVGVAPLLRWTHWLNRDKRSINCPGKDCPICEIRRRQKANKEPYTYGVNKRLALYIINRSTNKLEICEQGVTFFDDLKILRADAAEKGLDLTDFDIKVRRTGTGADDTKYRLDIGEVYPLTEADKALAEEMIDLEEYFKPHTVEQINAIVRDGKPFDEVMKATSDNQEEIEVR